MKDILERDLDIAILEAQADADEMYDLFIQEFLGSRAKPRKAANNGSENLSPSQAGGSPSLGGQSTPIPGPETGSPANPGGGEAAPAGYSV